MKKRRTVFIVMVVLAGSVAALATAGSENDPLGEISQDAFKRFEAVYMDDHLFSAVGPGDLMVTWVRETNRDGTKFTLAYETGEELLEITDMVLDFTDKVSIRWEGYLGRYLTSGFLDFGHLAGTGQYDIHFYGDDVEIAFAVDRDELREYGFGGIRLLNSTGYGTTPNGTLGDGGSWNYNGNLPNPGTTARTCRCGNTALAPLCPGISSCDTADECTAGGQQRNCKAFLGTAISFTEL